MNTIHLTPGQVPLCDCGSKDWTVKQVISREADLERVDGLGDIKMFAPNVMSYQQALAMQCKECKLSYLVPESVEGWFEKGGEDSFGWTDMVEATESLKAMEPVDEKEWAEWLIRPIQGGVM